jgi:UPF0716 protein FxsA
MKEEQPKVMACCESDERAGHALFRRLSVVVAGIVVLDWIFLAILVGWFGWQLPLVETAVMGTLGLLVIIYYEWRWSEPVALRLQSEPGLVDGWSFERILLLIAGVVLLLPGVMTDVMGVLLLMPGIRRTIVHLVNLSL